MSVQKESKNKIGARCLSDSEVELILPNYKRIYDQINQFRAEKKSVDNFKKKKVNCILILFWFLSVSLSVCLMETGSPLCSPT